MNRRLILISMVLLAASPIASCDDVTWTDKHTHTIDWDDPEFSVGSFTVKLTDFDGEGSVVLEIIRNEEETGETIVKIVLTRGEVWDNDEIRLECEDATDKNDLESIGRWPWSPEAKIISYVAEKKEPDISIDISIDDIEYLYGDEITAEITIDNDGDADMYDVLLNISLDGLNLTDGKLIHHIGTIKSDCSRSITIKLRFSMPPKVGDVGVEVTGRDEDGIEYYEEGSEQVKLKTPLVVRKFATPDIYWGRAVYVSISVRNIQNYGIRSVVLSDEIPDRFNINGSSLNWTFDIRPDEVKNYQYCLIPEKPGSFTLPAARASWQIWDEDYDVYSDRPTVDVHGAFMDVVKAISPEHPEIGETANVTIDITNTCDLPASIRLIDQIPANTSYISGTTNLTTFMRPQETERLSYAIRINSDDVDIPEPVVEFEEMVYDERTVNYTGNYEVTMRVTAVTELAPDSDSTEPAQILDLSETPKPESMGKEQKQNKTLRKQINEKAREAQQSLKSIEDMMMPGFDGAWLMIMILVVYVIRRVF